jgi:hypothetical protein
MRKTNSTRLAALALTLIASSGCAGMQPSAPPAPLAVKRWFLDSHSLQLIWTPENGDTERMAFPDADGYRCYSRSDDQAIRELIAALRARCEAPAWGQLPWVAPK